MSEQQSTQSSDSQSTMDAISRMAQLVAGPSGLMAGNAANRGYGLTNITNNQPYVDMARNSTTLLQQLYGQDPTDPMKSIDSYLDTALFSQFSKPSQAAMDAAQLNGQYLKIPKSFDPKTGIYYTGALDEHGNLIKENMRGPGINLFDNTSRVYTANAGVPTNHLGEPLNNPLYNQQTTYEKLDGNQGPSQTIGSPAAIAVANGQMATSSATPGAYGTGSRSNPFSTATNQKADPSGVLAMNLLTDMLKSGKGTPGPIYDYSEVYQYLSGIQTGLDEIAGSSDAGLRTTDYNSVISNIDKAQKWTGEYMAGMPLTGYTSSTQNGGATTFGAANGISYTDNPEWSRLNGLNQYLSELRGNVKSSFKATPDKAFTADQAYNYVTNLPGYQAQFTEGRNALDTSAAARGMLFSGGQMKDLHDYGQRMLDSQFQTLTGTLMGQAGLSTPFVGAQAQQQNMLGSNIASALQGSDMRWFVSPWTSQQHAQSTSHSEGQSSGSSFGFSL